LGSKDFLVLVTAVFCLDVRHEQVDGFTQAMFKTATDGILLYCLSSGAVDSYKFFGAAYDVPSFLTLQRKQ